MFTTLQQLAASGFTINHMRPYIGEDGQSYITGNDGKTPVPVANALLTKDAWQSLDREIQGVFRDNIVGIADLRSRGLVRNLGGLGVLTDQWQTSSDMTEADVDMDGETEPSRDRVDFSLNAVPIPIIHKSFKIGRRHLEASRNAGTPLDTYQAAIASRLVAEKAEDLLFNGSTVKSDGYALYGYLNHPNRNSITTARDWGTKANITASIRAMIAALEADNVKPPYMLYVNKTQFGETRADEGTDLFSNVKARIKMAYPEVEDMKWTQAMPDGTAAMVGMNKMVVDLALGVDIMTVQYEIKGGMAVILHAFTAMAPRVKADYDGRCGVAVHTNI